MEAYYEVQKMDKWWMKLLFLLPIAIMIWLIFSGGHNPENKNSYYFALVAMGLLAALFFFLKLELRVDEAGITIRYFPFQRVYYYVRWDEIESAWVRTYKPIMEYGGWGLRYSFRNGKAYNVYGNKGLQLHLKSGKKFLIGTQKADALQNYLEILGKEKNISCIR